VFIGEVRGDFASSMVWKTPARPGDAWSEFLDGSKDRG
jgi:hypothetical protein